MVVTRSRLHAVRTRLALDACLAEKGHPWKALVAFSGTVKDGGEAWTESGMNSAGQDRVIGERQTAAEFEKPEYRFLVVASKFQTGFDQPLLHTMYVDKKLGGVNAVQTLSRLNRTHPGKQGVMVLDFANEAEEIRKAFEPYYETTLLSEATDPNLLYEVQDRLLGFGVFTEGDVDAFARVCFDPGARQDRLYAAFEPPRQRFGALAADEGRDFRGQLGDYVRLYSFLSQVLTFADVDLEKLYVFARHLRRLLPADQDELPREVQQNIDMESFRIQQTSRGRIALERQGGALDPAGSKPRGGCRGVCRHPIRLQVTVIEWRPACRGGRSPRRLFSDPFMDYIQSHEVPMSLSERIKPISYLKAHAAEILRTLGDRPEPLIITQNGEAKAVVQDIDSYERMQESVALLKMLALGNRQIEAGQVQPAGKVVARLRARRRAD